MTEHTITLTDAQARLLVGAYGAFATAFIGHIERDPESIEMSVVITSRTIAEAKLHPNDLEAVSGQIRRLHGLVGIPGGKSTPPTH